MANGNSKNIVDEAKKEVDRITADTQRVREIKEGLEEQARQKREELESETGKPEREQDKEKIARLSSDITGISEQFRQLKEALEALAVAARELKPVLEELVKLGESLAETVLDLINELLELIEALTKSITNLIKALGELLKVALVIPLLLQKAFDISITGSVIVQPLTTQPVTVLKSVTDKDFRILNEIGVHTLGDLSEADLADLQRCGINVERVSMLQEEAKVAVRPFSDEFRFLIEELDLSLMQVARRSETDFIQPRERIRIIRADILRRSAVLKPDILEEMLVTDLIDVKVPKGFGHDCLPQNKLGLNLSSLRRR